MTPVNSDNHNSIMATLEEMSDPRALRALRGTEEDERAGRIYTYEEAFGHPPSRFVKQRK